MSALSKQLVAARASIRRAREDRREIMQMAGQQLVGNLGGATGAIVKRYLPQLVPGEAGDMAAVWVSSIMLDGAALYTGSPYVNAYAIGYGGYLTGSMLEKILP